MLEAADSSGLPLARIGWSRAGRAGVGSETEVGKGVETEQGRCSDHTGSSAGTQRMRHRTGPRYNQLVLCNTLDNLTELGWL